MPEYIHCGLVWSKCPWSGTRKVAMYFIGEIIKWLEKMPAVPKLSNIPPDVAMQVDRISNPARQPLSRKR
eukprot:666787-Amphidinium_carterae.1